MKKVIVIIISVLLIMFLVTVFENSGKHSSSDKIENKIMVYSTYDEKVLNYLKSQFKNKTGIDIEFKIFNTSKELEDALQKEKNNSKVDLILGGESSLYKKLTSEGMLEKNYPSWCKDVDSKNKDKDGYWYGSSKSVLALFYNNEVLNDFPAITDVQSLGNPKYKDLIAIEKLEEFRTKALVATIIYPYYKSDKLEDGFKVLSSIKANVKPQYVEYSKLITSVEAKEIGIGFAQIDKINREKVKNNTPLNILDTNGQMIMVTEGCGIIKGASNVNAAKLFEEFSVGPKVQLELANKFGTIPVHSISLKNSPQNINTIINKVIDIEEINSNLDFWIDKWNSLSIEAPKESLNNNQKIEEKKDKRQQVKTKVDQGSANKVQNHENEELENNQTWE